MSKTIAITGAGDGLGRALARRFAAELGPPHFAIQCDVGDPVSVRAAFVTLAGRHPRIDVLINNAAIYEPFLLADARDDQIMAQTLANFVGPVFVSRSAVPLLRGQGHIIYVTTESATIKMPMLWLYEATKVGVEFMSEMWTRELEPEGIRVTVVRAGQMYDETKVGSGWLPEVSMAFAEANAKVGIHLRQRPVSHYKSVTDAFRAVLDMPADLHMDMVSLCARKRGRTRSRLIGKTPHDDASRRQALYRWRAARCRGR